MPRMALKTGGALRSISVISHLPSGAPVSLRTRHQSAHLDVQNSETAAMTQLMSRLHVWTNSGYKTRNGQVKPDCRIDTLLLRRQPSPGASRHPLPCEGEGMRL